MQFELLKRCCRFLLVLVMFQLSLSLLVGCCSSTVGVALQLLLLELKSSAVEDWYRRCRYLSASAACWRFSGELADVTAVVWLSAVVDSNSGAAQCRHFYIKPLPAPPPLPSFLNNSFSHLGKKYSNNVTARN
jgi:hypothetical protein